MFDLWYRGALEERLARPFVHLVFGARQTGKSTLLRSLLPPDALSLDLSDPRERTRHLADPGLFAQEYRALPQRSTASFVFVDEAQSVPSIFDAVQHLYDGDKARWRFVLCGSSARKLRRIGGNLLPGRSFLHRLFPLTLAEQPSDEPSARAMDPALPLPWPSRVHDRPFPPAGLSKRLAYGALPGIVTAATRDRADLLRAFASVHLEEEIRREALVKDWGAFSRFLRLAAAESGQIVNFAGLSKESGVSQPTVKSYYQLLEDMFIGFRVEVFSRSATKSILSTPKFLLFDMGVRHAAADLTPGPEIVRMNPGAAFEHWVGIELWKRLQYLGDGRLHHFRTKDGAEIDYIVERQDTLTPHRGQMDREANVAGRTPSPDVPRGASPASQACPDRLSRPTRSTHSRARHRDPLVRLVVRRVPRCPPASVVNDPGREVPSTRGYSFFGSRSPTAFFASCAALPVASLAFSANLPASSSA